MTYREYAVCSELSCGVSKPLDEMDYLSVYETSTRYVGFYCHEHAEEMRRASQRVCSVCGEEYITSFPFGDPKNICGGCRRKSPYWFKFLQLQLSRARLLGRAATLTKAEWKKALQYFDDKCAYCGHPWTVIEHFIPVGAGGGTTADNCVPACFSCNCLKSDKVPGVDIEWKSFKRVREYFNSLK